jgi:hypothetical protein
LFSAAVATGLRIWNTSYAFAGQIQNCCRRNWIDTKKPVLGDIDSHYELNFMHTQEASAMPMPVKKWLPDDRVRQRSAKES